jgi:multidrug efflux system outer membrane protein
MIPKYERPPRRWPTTFPGPGAAAAAGRGRLPWQQFFTDPQLRELIAPRCATTATCASRCSTSSRRARSYDIRRADQFPTVGAGISGSRRPMPRQRRHHHLHRRLAVLTPGSSTSSAASQPERSGAGAVPGHRRRPQGGADQPGRRVANAWLALLADEELLALTQQTLATREESLQADASCASTTA